MVHRQVTSYLSTSKLFPPFSSAYRSQHSTEMALVKVFSDIVDDVDDRVLSCIDDIVEWMQVNRLRLNPSTLDDGNIAILALLDLTAAFDMVDLRILLQRLQRSLGIDEMALRWFESNVIGRTQSVHLSNNTTPPRTLVCGVSQEYVLGPLLFVLYTADIGSIIAAHGLLHHCYADDTQIYFFCHPSNSASLKDRVLSWIDDIADGCK